MIYLVTTHPVSMLIGILLRCLKYHFLAFLPFNIPNWRLGTQVDLHLTNADLIFETSKYSIPKQQRFLHI